MKLPLLYFLLCLNGFAIAQDHRYQNLIDTVTAGKGTVYANSSPIKQLDLDPTLLKDYFNNYKYFSHKQLDTVMFMQIIQNANSSDTTEWRPEEMRKLKIINKTDGTAHGILYNFSRPVFDNSKQFAVVQWHNAHHGRGGGGEINLYELRGDTWITAGTILHWVY